MEGNFVEASDEGIRRDKDHWRLFFSAVRRRNQVYRRKAEPAVGYDAIGKGVTRAEKIIIQGPTTTRCARGQMVHGVSTPN